MDRPLSLPVKHSQVAKLEHIIQLHSSFYVGFIMEQRALSSITPQIICSDIKKPWVYPRLGERGGKLQESARRSAPPKRVKSPLNI